MYRRFIEERTEAALTDAPVVFLNGARRSGKTALARVIASGRPVSTFLTLDDAVVLASARRIGDPERPGPVRAHPAPGGSPMAIVRHHMASVVALALALAACSRVEISPLDVCRMNFGEIHGMLAVQHAGTGLRPLAGKDFLLQVAEHFGDVDLAIFCCPLDPLAPKTNPRSSPWCSYFGPDVETARRLVSADWTVEPAILAGCDHHEDGVRLLRAGGACEVLKGIHVLVGPGSPDPRLRHLVR